MMTDEATTIEDGDVFGHRSKGRPHGARRACRLRSLREDRGAVGTEMAIVVAIVVGIALALGAVMINSARSHQSCIPATAGASTGPGCP